MAETIKNMAVVKSVILMMPKGPADREPGAKLLNKVLQMDGEAVARELPAAHQLITDGWGRDSYFPSLVYIPEKDRLLLLYNNRPAISQDSTASRLVLMASDDHGETWRDITASIRDARGAPYHLTSGLGLAYFGKGQLAMTAADDNSDQSSLFMFSHDCGETWASSPVPKDSGGFPWWRWDPCAADTDPATGELKRLIDGGYFYGMEGQYSHAKRIAVLPNEWHWRHDPADKGLAEKWYEEKALDTWKRVLRIDKHWTEQGEPLGIGWYATHFEMPDTGGVPLMILFGAVDGCCDVFVDGRKAGEQKLPPEIMWERPFHIALEQGISPGRHTMVIRVQKDSDNAGIWLPIWIAEKPPEIRKSFRNFSSGIRFSYDGGLTFPEEIRPPVWNDGREGIGTSEIAFCRAGNGDLVAACRLRRYDRFPSEKYRIDHYAGLGVSLSRDNGYNWSKVKVLYDYGRHHPCMALMPNGDIVMSYVTRLGLLEKEHRQVDEDGYPQWGVEAVISRDHGENWDLSHRYVLAKWSGMSQAQATATVCLPGGSLLTAFGSGYLSRPVPEEKRQGESNLLCTHEVGLVKWRLDG